MEVQKVNKEKQKLYAAYKFEYSLSGFQLII